MSEPMRGVSFLMAVSDEDGNRWMMHGIAERVRIEQVHPQPGEGGSSTDVMGARIELVRPRNVSTQDIGDEPWPPTTG